MSHRVFVALPISEKLQNKVLEWEKDLPSLPVRYIRGGNLHVTLLPPWSVEDLSGLGAMLRQGASRHGRFIIRLNEVSFGPNTYQPRLVWATGSASIDIVEVRDDLADIFSQIKEAKPFKLHMTIAYFRPEDFSAFPVRRLDKKVEWVEGINSIVLMESHPSRDGVDYEIIDRAPIG